jgi:YbbR domain-containing protein
VTRVLAFLVYNWPLKLAAVMLATLLYAGFVVSQNAQTLNVSVPISVQNQPPNAVLLSDPGSITQITYLTDGTASRPSAATLRAFVDLSNVDPNGETVRVPVQVEAAESGIEILEVVPNAIPVQLDPFATRTVPVTVDQGDVPAGLDVRDPTVVPTEVEVSGPQSLVRLVTEARARVLIEPEGLDVDRDVALVPVDLSGDRVPRVEVTPQSARVTIRVFTDLASRSLPVNPTISGDPARGFRVTSVSVDPPIVSVEGDADAVRGLTDVGTDPISIAGATSTTEADVRLVLPNGVLPLGREMVRVRIELEAVTETRSFNAGVVLVGARSDRTYALSTDAVTVTLGGTVADLARVAGGGLVARADVSGLSTGQHDVNLAVTLPPGVALVGISPGDVGVTVGVAATPTPVPASPSASPSPTPVPE